MGQFSGHTYETKVGDIEESLRKAVIALDTIQGVNGGRKADAVRHLAERLLAARLKLLRARIASAKEQKCKRGKVFSEAVPHLVARARGLEGQGAKGILKEFGAYKKIPQ